MDTKIKGKPLSEETLGNLTLGGFLREVCEKHSEREALVFHPESGPAVRMSYAQVWDEAFAIARALIARGITKDTRVGLLATNRPEWVTAMFGVALAGGTCVALSTFAKGEELEYMIRHADVSLLIFERSVLKRDFAQDILSFCPELGTEQPPVYSDSLPFLRRAVCIDSSLGGAIEDWDDFVHGDLKAPAHLVDAIADQIAPIDRGLIYFSSGSTSKPKGVIHSHRAAALQSWRWPKIYNLDENVRVWTANGFFFSGNFTQAIAAALASGGCLVLQRYFDPGEALRLMEKEKVNLPVAWPHQNAQLAEDPAWNEVDLSSLYYVSDYSPLRTHPTVSKDLTWQEPTSAYGSTETLTLSSVHPSDTDPEIAAGNSGFPLPGNIFRIVDPETREVLPIGQTGEITVKGPTTMLGYLRVVPEDSFDEEGFFHTGDGGFFDEMGRLHWHGRLNDIIKTGGANVSPLEIDAVARECPGVKLAATVGIPHDTLGELVVTCIVCEEGTTLEESTVRGYISERLSSYKVPRRVLFLEESDLEMTASNKVKTAPLRVLAAKLLAD